MIPKAAQPVTVNTSSGVTPAAVADGALAAPAVALPDSARPSARCAMSSSRWMSDCAGRSRCSITFMTRGAFCSHSCAGVAIASTTPARPTPSVRSSTAALTALGTCQRLSHSTGLESTKATSMASPRGITAGRPSRSTTSRQQIAMIHSGRAQAWVRNSARATGRGPVADIAAVSANGNDGRRTALTIPRRHRRHGPSTLPP